MTAASEMHYIDVQWIHSDEAEPVRLMSELDGERFETRKLAFFRDGRVEHADATFSTDRTELGQVAVPALAEINGDAEFHGIGIERDVFEAEWRRAVGS